MNRAVNLADLKTITVLSSCGPLFASRHLTRLSIFRLPLLAACGDTTIVVVALLISPRCFECICRTKFAQHRWDEFGDRWMDRYGARQHVVGNVRIHNVQNPVNRFVAACAEDRRAENSASFRVHDDFHEALRLAFFDGAAAAAHRAAADQEWPAARATPLPDRAVARADKQSLCCYPFHLAVIGC